MLKTKVFDFSNKIIGYGYSITNNENNRSYSLESIVSSVNNNIIVFDSNNNIIDSLINSAISIINDNDKLFIGLVSENKLVDLKRKNLNGGFFRSTNEKISGSIIIVDEKDYYLAFNSETIFKLGSGDTFKELFNLINHYIWAKSTAELCKGRFKNINESRLSVFYPEIKTGKEYSSDEVERFSNQNGYIISNYIANNSNNFVTKINLGNAFLNENKLYINLFDKYYYCVNNDESLYKAISFSNKTLNQLSSLGNDVWINNNVYKILNYDFIEDKIYKPLDSYKTYEPDFDSYSDKYNKLSKELKVSVDVLPMVVDSSFKPSPKYEKINKYKTQMSSAIDKLKSFYAEDKKELKQIETIEKEHNLLEKASLYNKFISSNEVGVSSLNNSKNNFKQIIVKEEDLVVPNELLGKLYIKGNNEYLALKSESDLLRGKDWLKDNNYSATLVLLNE